MFTLPGSAIWMLQHTQTTNYEYYTTEYSSTRVVIYQKGCCCNDWFGGSTATAVAAGRSSLCTVRSRCYGGGSLAGSVGITQWRLKKLVLYYCTTSTVQYKYKYSTVLVQRLTRTTSILHVPLSVVATVGTPELLTQGHRWRKSLLYVMYLYWSTVYFCTL
jgi:hypothetical protein